MNCWHVYLLLCENNKLYCGVTVDLDNRLKNHKNGTGAKFTQKNKPIKYVWSTECKNRSSAQKLEYKIKQLSRSQKNEVVLGNIFP